MLENTVRMYSNREYDVVAIPGDELRDLGGVEGRQDAGEGGLWYAGSA
jgi:hypothetical protein